jgi:hypothetical protein
MMKGFLIFGGRCYYARGGFHDLVGIEWTLDAAKKQAERLLKQYESGGEMEWYQIVDAETCEVMASTEEQPLGAGEYGVHPFHIKFMAGAAVPQRIKPWEGGQRDTPPHDWVPGGLVIYRNHGRSKGATEYMWDHVGGPHDIVAYDPNRWDSDR